MWLSWIFSFFSSVTVTTYRGRDKKRICVFYVFYMSRYAHVSKNMHVRYAKHFLIRKALPIWSVSDLFTFLSVIQTEFCVPIYSWWNSRLFPPQMDGKPVSDFFFLTFGTIIKLTDNSVLIWWTLLITIQTTDIEWVHI